MVKQPNFRAFFVVLLPVLVTAWLYFPALRLPFFSDDVLHFYYAANTSAFDIWTKPDVTLLYYRPVINFLLHVALVPLNAPLFAAGWHFVLVANHLLNVALVGALAREVRLPLLGQAAAMMVFGVFPFSTQAVVWILAWFHPLVTTLLLIVVVGGLRWLKCGRRPWLIATCAAGMIAPFTHENGFLGGALLMGLAVTFLGLPVLFTRWRRVVLMIAPLGLGALAYFVMRTTVSPPSWSLPNVREFLLPNLAVFAQGLSYPLQALTVFLPVQPLVQAAIGVSIAGMMSVLWWYRGRFALRAAFAGVLWWALASFPAAVGLPSGYITLGERLLYVVSPGVALLAGGLAAVPNRRRAVSVVMTALTIGSCLLVREYQRLYLVLGEGYQEVFQEFRPYFTASTLVINAPLQIDSERYVFPYTRIHAFMLHEYISLDHFFWLNSGQMPSRLNGVEVFDARTRWPGYAVHFYGEGVSGDALYTQMRAAQRIILFTLDDSAGGQRVSGRVVGVRQAAETQILADFDRTVRLASVDFARHDDRTLQVTLHWTKLRPDPLPHVAFVHLICDEQIVDQVDASPVADLHPFAVWLPGESWRDQRYMDTAGRPEACLNIRVGLYRRDNGERAALTDANGTPMTVEWLTLPVQWQSLPAQGQP